MTSKGFRESVQQALMIFSRSSTHSLKVWRNNFWMLHHGSKSPKRTTVWSVRQIVVSKLVLTLEHHKFQVLMGDQTFNLFSAPLPIARYQDKGPLKKVVKDKKTKVKTTRLKLGLSLFVGLGGYCPTF